MESNLGVCGEIQEWNLKIINIYRYAIFAVSISKERDE